MSPNRNQESGCLFWFVILPIIILAVILLGSSQLATQLIFGWFKSGNEMDKKKRITNIIGVIVLGTIIIGVTLQRGIEWMKQEQFNRHRKEHSRQLADDLAFALVNDGSGDVVMQWARGEYLDAWKHPFVIEYNTQDKGSCVRSYGEDGIPNTEDDLLSRVFLYDQNRFKIEPRPAVGGMDEIKERLEGAKRNINQTIENMKNSEGEVEKEKGWRFNFKWNWGKNDDKEN